MMLDVSRALKEPGKVFPLRVEEQIAPQEINGDTVTFEPALMEGSYTAVEHGSISIRGELTVRAHGHCANCLSEAAVEVREPFEELFILGGDPNDTEVFTYTGQELDLTHLAMSTAVLGLPLRFLCREDCDRVPAFNVPGVDVRLHDEELPVQRPFAALKQLLEDN